MTTTTNVPSTSSVHHPPQKNSGVRLGVGCLIICGLIFVIGSTGAILDEGDIVGFLAASLFGALFLGTAFYWLRWARGKEGRARRIYEEKAILEVAAAHAGVVTLARITLLTPLTSDEAEAAMTRLCSKGLARIDVTEDGDILYRFSGLEGQRGEMGRLEE